MPDLATLDQIVRQTQALFNQGSCEDIVAEAISKVSEAAAHLEHERHVSRDALQEPYTV